MFNEDERKLAMIRLFHDQPAIVSHKEKATWGLIKRGVFNINVLVGAWIFTCNQITVQGLSIFTATILRLNFPDRSLIQIQLLSSAPPLVGMVFGLIVAYVTMKMHRHGVAIAACASLCVLGYAIWLGSQSPLARFAAIFLNTAGGYGFGVLTIGWTLSNAAPDTAKNVANAAVSGIANIGTQSYRSLCATACSCYANVQTRVYRCNMELYQHRCEEWLQDWQFSEHGYGTLCRCCIYLSCAIPDKGERQACDWWA